MTLPFDATKLKHRITNVQHCNNCAGHRSSLPRTFHATRCHLQRCDTLKVLLLKKRFRLALAALARILFANTQLRKS